MQYLKIRWGPKFSKFILGSILVVSLLIGVLSTLQYQYAPYFNHPIVDENSYVTWAEGIAKGQFIGKEIFYQGPLYPYFLALIFIFFGKNLLLVRLLQVFIGTLSISLVYCAAKKLLGQEKALLAAGVMAAYSGLYFFELLILKAILVIFFSTLVCNIGIAVVEQPHSKRRWFSLGVTLGVLTLLRGNVFLILPFVLVWAYFFFKNTQESKNHLKSALIPVISIILGIGLILFPISIRNYIVGGEFVITTSQGGSNFYIGNNEMALGHYRAPSFVRGNPKYQAHDFKLEAEKQLGRELSPSKVSHYWFMEGLKWIAKNPAQAIRLYFHKARLIVHQFEVPNNHNFYFVKKYFVPALGTAFLGFGALWGPALLGLLILVRQDNRSQFIALFSLLYALSLLPFYVVARYRLVLLPEMAIFASFFFFWLLKNWRVLKNRMRIAIFTCLMGSWLIGFYPIVESREPMTKDFYTIGKIYVKTGNPEEAIEWYDKAIEINSDPKYQNARKKAIQRVQLEIQNLLKEAQMPQKSKQELIQIATRLAQLGQKRSARDILEKFSIIP